MAHEWHPTSFHEFFGKLGLIRQKHPSGTTRIDYGMWSSFHDYEFTSRAKVLGAAAVVAALGSYLYFGTDVGQYFN